MTGSGVACHDSPHGELMNCLLCGEDRPTEAAIRVKVADEIRAYAEVAYPPACSATLTALFLADRIARVARGGGQDGG